METNEERLERLLLMVENQLDEVIRENRRLKKRLEEKNDTVES